MQKDMEREKVINRIIRDMRQFGLIGRDRAGEERTDEVMVFLNALWVAGYEYRGRKLTAHNNKKVIRFNSKGDKICEYNSVVEASIELNVGVTGLYSAILRGSRTRKGYYFRYAE